jgi:hypothetical protein
MTPRQPTAPCRWTLRHAWQNDADAYGEFAPQRAGALNEDERVLPSFGFDPCCSVARKQALLEVVAKGFVDRHDTLVITRDLSALSRRARSTT